MSGWEIEWRQLEAGVTQHQFGAIASQGTIIQSFCLSKAFHHKGVAPSEMVTFGFTYPGSQLNIAGKEVLYPAVVDFNNPDGFDIVSGSSFSGISVSIARDKLSRIASQLGLPNSSLTDSNHLLLKSAEDQAFTQFRQLLRGLYQRLHQGSGTNDIRWATEALEKELPYHLLESLADSRHQPSKYSINARHKGLRVATAFIEANGHNNPSVPEICTVAGLSSRSLDRAFKEYFGVGPKRYLLNLRLIQVRRKLKRASPTTKVTDVANDWAFWHMGDFAREYLKLFGEYPAETLRI